MLQRVLDNNSEGFLRYVPVDTMLPILERRRILDKRDVTNIRIQQHEADRIDSLFKMFYNHLRGIDLLTFCRLLKMQDKCATQEFGRKMELELTQSTS